MRSKTLIKKCNCIHCQEKEEQVNLSKEYWSRVVAMQFKVNFK